MFPVLDLGPFAVQAAGMILILSLWLGFWLTGKFSENLDTNGNVIENGLLYGLLAGLLGARVGFLLQNPAILMAQPLSLVSLTPSMLNGSFGVLVGLLTLIIIYQNKHLPLWPTLDTLTPLLLFLFAGVQLANFANGNAYGLPTTLPWGVSLWNAVRHPVQLYALLLALILLGWLLVQTKRLRMTGFLHSGTLFSLVTAGLAAITLFMQAFVAEKASFLGLDLVQIGAFLVLAGSLYLAYRLAFQPQKPIPVFISLGANQNADANLTQAIARISEAFKVRLASSRYQTQDVRPSDQPLLFVNQIIEIETSLPYPELVSWLKDLEGQFGREPGNKTSVPLDLDVITYGSEVFRFGMKQVPDPGLTQYRYVAQPLAEIAPDFRHPATGNTIQATLTALDDSNQPTKKIDEVENGTER